MHANEQKMKDKRLPRLLGLSATLDAASLGDNPGVYAKFEQGGPNPFIDPAGYTARIDSSEKTFNDRLNELEILSPR
jgi:hypothetical protein